MEVRKALQGQYHAGLKMLAQCVERCPECLWLEGESPRTFWRIAFHAAHFTHLYLGQDEAAFRPWPARKQGIHHRLWHLPEGTEPYELPADAEIYGRDEILAYIRFIDEMVDDIIDGLDLSSPETGFAWYPDMSKLSHQMLNLRHLQGHIGQMSELLMARGIEIDWI